MSEEKQYLDEHWDDVPLPDEELAWQKMQLLMDEDKKRRRVLPFWFWRYAGIGLLLTGLGVGTWYLLDKNKIETETSSVSPTVSRKQINKNSAILEANKVGSIDPTVQKIDPIVQKKDVSILDKDQPSGNVLIRKSTVTKEPTISKKEPIIANTNTNRKNIKETTVLQKTNEVPTEEPLANKTPESSSVAAPTARQNKLEPSTPVVTPKKDSTITKDTIATKIAEPVTVKEKKKKEKKEVSEELVFSAGIGLQQAIAFDGQQTSSYNYKGKRNALSDRIPSVYIRLQKQKWYLQAEFQYAAPQPVKQFVFSQKTRYSIASQNLNTEQFSIQKLYYHQLPLTINYYVLPNLSIGSGIMYSILAGAVTEQAIRSKNVLTGNESVSKNITPVNGFKDSFLYKTTAGIVLQTDYHMNRFSLGLRFSKNLLSFIRYTSPNGEIMDEKNKSLQAILRFRLWEK